MYLNLIQVAESLGVSEHVVAGWIRYEGLPHTPDRGMLLFDRSQVAQWAVTRGLAIKAGLLARPAGERAKPLSLGPLLRAGGIWRDVPSASVPETYGRIAMKLPNVSEEIREFLAARFRQPSNVSTAPVGVGYALPHPHARVALGRESAVLALILLSDPLPIMQQPVDDVPVTRLFFFIAPSPRTHLQLIGKLSHLLLTGTFEPVVARGGTDDELLEVVDAVDRGDAPGALVGEGVRVKP